MDFNINEKSREGVSIVGEVAKKVVENNHATIVDFTGETVEADFMVAFVRTKEGKCVSMGQGAASITDNLMAYHAITKEIFDALTIAHNMTPAHAVEAISKVGGKAVSECMKPEDALELLMNMIKEAQ